MDGSPKRRMDWKKNWARRQVLKRGSEKTVMPFDFLILCILTSTTETSLASAKGPWASMLLCSTNHWSMLFCLFDQKEELGIITAEGLIARDGYEHFHKPNFVMNIPWFMICDLRHMWWCPQQTYNESPYFSQRFMLCMLVVRAADTTPCKSHLKRHPL